ncbi:MAG: DNA polymerase III subunit gamma and tau [Buchananella hordeovulneris]|nr:DNA polymerase III subunit gamma and tau [Buchananella hordeovulneris]
MTTALYRRYRPESFADVIGQSHVTEPLMAALRADRITHAYLFSGPRGCGKTTSARILARCLNCAQGPTDTPCGQCDSCRELSRSGGGSLDVVEIDAASHNGVDDARELRERAAFAPVRDRYKIFILDEAHMVTPQGFNALLKLVEEPPPHVKFIFATTEPERVIGTIRSRTHHYPFRLVPPEELTRFLEELCVREGVQVESGVLPLVIRAGGGSVRDSLSVLDQLIAGTIGGQLDYRQAVALLGYTDETLLDQIVSAFAADDGAGVFRVVERVIGAGQEPRRFVEDLLQRLRDLLVIAVTAENARDALAALPTDVFARMREQAKSMGAPALSRAADLANEALTSMVGATSPRLHVELLCARVLLALGQMQGIAAPGAGRQPAAAQEAARPRAVQPAAAGRPREQAGGERSPQPGGFERPAAPRRPEPQPEFVDVVASAAADWGDDWSQESVPAIPTPAPQVDDAPLARPQGARPETIRPDMNRPAAPSQGSDWGDDVQPAHSIPGRFEADHFEAGRPGDARAENVHAESAHAGNAHAKDVRVGDPRAGDGRFRAAGPEFGRTEAGRPVEGRPAEGRPMDERQRLGVQHGHPEEWGSAEGRSQGGRPGQESAADRFAGGREEGMDRPYAGGAEAAQGAPQGEEQWGTREFLPGGGRQGAPGQGQRQEFPAEARRPAPAAASAPAREPELEYGTTLSPAGSAGQGEMIRDRWSEVLNSLRGISQVVWALVSPNAHPGPVTDGVFALHIPLPGLLNAFQSRNMGLAVQQALRESLGLELSVEAVPGGPASQASPAPQGGDADPFAGSREAAPENHGTNHHSGYQDQPVRRAEPQTDRAGRGQVQPEPTVWAEPNPEPVGWESRSVAPRREGAGVGVESASVAAPGSADWQSAQAEPAGWAEPQADRAGRGQVQPEPAGWAEPHAEIADRRPPQPEPAGWDPPQPQPARTQLGGGYGARRETAPAAPAPAPQQDWDDAGEAWPEVPSSLVTRLDREPEPEPWAPVHDIRSGKRIDQRPAPALSLAQPPAPEPGPAVNGGEAPGSPAPDAHPVVPKPELHVPGMDEHDISFDDPEVEVNTEAGVHVMLRVLGGQILEEREVTSPL